MRNKSKGFSLIELMIVVSIVSLLSSLVAASVNTARARARDSARVQTTSSLKTALELYRAQHNQYPYHNGAMLTTSELVSTYLNEYMKSPLPPFFDTDGNTSHYYSDPAGTTYEITYATETSSYSSNNGCNSADYASLGDNSSCSGSNTGTPILPQYNHALSFSMSLDTGQSSVIYDNDTATYDAVIVWNLSNAESCEVTQSQSQAISEAQLDSLITTMLLNPTGSRHLTFTEWGSFTIACHGANGSSAFQYVAMPSSRDFAAP